MSNWIEKIYKFMNPSTTEIDVSTSNKPNIGLFRLVFYPFMMLFDKIGVWFKLAIEYSIILTIISFAFEYSYICAYNANNSTIFCNSSVWLYWAYMLIKIVILGFFATDWINIFLGKKCVFGQFFQISSTKLKTAGVLMVFMALLAVGIGAGYLLVIRVPNPNWKIEMGYFTVVSCGFLVPIFATRFYSILAYVAQGKDSFALKTIWKTTSGQTLKILFSLFTILIFAIFILGNYIMYFRYNGIGNLVIFAIISELFLNIFTLLLWTILVGNSLSQMEMMEK